MDSCRRVGGIPPRSAHTDGECCVVLCCVVLCCVVLCCVVLCCVVLCCVVLCCVVLCCVVLCCVVLCCVVLCCVARDPTLLKAKVRPPQVSPPQISLSWERVCANPCRRCHARDAKQQKRSCEPGGQLFQSHTLKVLFPHFSLNAKNVFRTISNRCVRQELPQPVH